MPTEFEYNFIDFDKKKIINILKENNGKKQDIYLFRVQIFTHPLNTKKTYIRIRDEGHRITLTYKYDLDKEFVKEDEVIINNFDEGCKILLNLGCTKKYYYEKIREIWNIGNVEICFDTTPGKPEIMEIEADNKKELLKTLDLFKLKIPKTQNLSQYNELFGIIIPHNTDLTFKNVKKVLGKHCKKNKNKFIKLVDEQLQLYLSVIKKV
jgi:predicted adenylyl cyclase CyaB